MSSIGARKQLKAALHHEQVAKSLLARFRIENAPSLKYAEARERYDRAARAYAAAGKPERCADAYGKCADMSARLSRGATAEAVEYHVRCGELSEANDPDRARDHYAEACDQCCDLGSWATAAELRHRVARLAARDAQDDEEGWSERVLLLRSAADMYGAAARRLHDETKAAKMRLCKLEAAAIEALQLKLYSRAADAFEAVATEVVQDNLTAANATRLFFKSALCSLVGGEHDLMRGKVEIFAKRDPVFGASPEKLFLVDANRCATAEGLPDYDTFADAAYNFCTVRSLDAWDLSMLKVLNDDMRVKYDAYWSRVKRRAAREKRRAQKRKEEEERQARMKRDEARFAACDTLKSSRTSRRAIEQTSRRWRHRSHKHRRARRRTRRTSISSLSSLRLGGVGGVSRHRADASLRADPVGRARRAEGSSLLSPGNQSKLLSIVFPAAAGRRGLG